MFSNHSIEISVYAQYLHMSVEIFGYAQKCQWNVLGAIMYLKILANAES